MLQEIKATVYPSNENTIRVVDDPIYGGAHEYHVAPCIGFNNGETEYLFDPEDAIPIPFVHKMDDGVMIPGLQSEQLALILMDRCIKLNNRFPSDQNAKMIEGLQMFLDACKERVEDRIKRGVMGKLKK